uniref:NPH3 domain-containing protein n=1 Tax=Leersia perrieri TaxID=77586 RepID=A0A0D9XNG1_9ORYZ
MINHSHKTGRESSLLIGMPQLTALFLMQAASTSNGGDIISSLAPASASVSASMDRTSQWVSSPDIPADLIIRIADDVFPLHKSVMAPKCGYIRKAVAATRGGATATVELDLSSLPGGADAFDKAARYCYGHNFDISVHNAAAILCSAAFLDMNPSPSDGGGGLARRVEDFLAKVALRTLSGAVAVLRSCEAATVSSAADETGVARRAADAVALRICNEALFPTRSPPDWWAAELAALSPPSFHKVIAALRCRRADHEVLTAASTAYAELALAAAGDHDAAMVESVVAVLPSTDDAPLPASLLCRLLHAAITIGASATTCRDMELRVAAVLDKATAGDLLAIALDAAGEHIQNTDTIRRIITAFVDRNAASINTHRNRRSSLSGALHGDIDGESAMQAVAKIVDELAAEMATEETLPISKFVGIAGAVPKEARATHDSVYRAVDIYLKAHPWLDEMEREKVCSVMDPLKLSYQGRLHASQNKRLPLQAVLAALYYDQLNLRSSNGNEMRRSEAGSVRKQAKADASLARENEALRSELARMKAYVSGMQQSKGSSSSSRGSSAMGKKGMSLWSRTLSMLNPFKAGGMWAKDTSSIVDGKTTIAKPKRRRFSIS